MPPPNSAVIATGDHAAIKTDIWFDAPSAFKKFDRKNSMKPMPTPIAISSNAFCERGGLRLTHAAIKLSAAKNNGRASMD